MGPADVQPSSFLPTTKERAGDAASYDAVIVLGAAVWPGGRPSPSLERRTRHAAALMLQGAGRHLVLTGGTGRHPPAEAVVMASIARSAGVAQDVMILEDRAANTIGSARRCRRIFTERGLRTAVIVTDPFHLGRSLAIFRWLGIDADGAVPEGSSRRHLGTGPWLRHVVREGAAWPWTIARLMALRPWPATVLLRRRR